MPYVKLQTNKDIAEEKREAFSLEISKVVAEALKKPESYVMTAVEPNISMSFAGSCKPAVFMELKSIGLSDSETKLISEKLCVFIQGKLDINKDRVYIEFASAAGSMWGWKGSTF